MGKQPSLRELLATLQAEADLHGESRCAVLSKGATLRYRSRVEGDRRRRQMIVGRPDVAPGVVEMQTFAGFGYVPRDAVEAHFSGTRDGVTWYYVTLTWEVAHIVMPQAELPL